MKKILILALLTVFCWPNNSTAQTREIKGIVSNEKNEHIAGAVVKVKGTTLSALTDDNGAFVLNAVPDTAFIVISASGYQPAEIPVADKSTFTVTLIAIGGNDQAAFSVMKRHAALKEFALFKSGLH